MLTFVVNNILNMDLREAQKLAESLMYRHLNGCDNQWKFQFDNVKKRFGYCKWGSGGIVTGKLPLVVTTV